MTENKTPRDREESHMKMEVETGMMLPQTKDTRSNQDLDGARKESPLGPSGGAWLCQHFDFGPLVSRTVREYICII